MHKPIPENNILNSLTFYLFINTLINDLLIQKYQTTISRFHVFELKKKTHIFTLPKYYIT